MLQWTQPSGGSDRSQATLLNKRPKTRTEKTSENTEPNDELTRTQLDNMDKGETRTEHWRREDTDLKQNNKCICTHTVIHTLTIPNSLNTDTQTHTHTDTHTQ